MDKRDFQLLERLTKDMTPVQRKTEVQNLCWKTWKLKLKRGTLELATGVGKTRIAVLSLMEAFAINPNACIVIAVPTETLRDVDWPSEMTKWGAGHLISKVILVCWKSLHDLPIPSGEVDLFIGDEGHHITPRSAVFFDNVKVFEIMFLTATVPKKSAKNLNESWKAEWFKALVPSVIKITVEEAARLKLVAEFKLEVLLYHFDSVTFNVEYKGEKTTEASKYLAMTKMLAKAMASGKTGWGIKLMGERKRFLENLPSKTKMAQDILPVLTKGEKRTIVFCGSIAQAEAICGDQVYHSETDDSMLKKFQSGEIFVLGCVNALDEGKNISDLYQCLIVQMTSSSRKIVQRIGRTIRFDDEKSARVIILVAQVKDPNKTSADEKWCDSALVGISKDRIIYHNVNTPTYESSGSNQVVGEGEASGSEQGGV